MHCGILVNVLGTVGVCYTLERAHMLRLCVFALKMQCGCVCPCHEKMSSVVRYVWGLCWSTSSIDLQDWYLRYQPLFQHIPCHILVSSRTAYQCMGYVHSIFEGLSLHLLDNLDGPRWQYAVMIQVIQNTQQLHCMSKRPASTYMLKQTHTNPGYGPPPRPFTVGLSTYRYTENW